VSPQGNDQNTPLIHITDFLQPLCTAAAVATTRVPDMAASTLCSGAAAVVPTRGSIIHGDPVPAHPPPAPLVRAGSTLTRPPCQNCSGLTSCESSCSAAVVRRGETASSGSLDEFCCQQLMQLVLVGCHFKRCG
jgi:hypothetical protein